MNGLKRQIAAVTAAIVVLAASLLLLSYAQWVRGIGDGNRALANENFSRAEQAYTAAEKWASRTLIPSTFLRRDYRVLVFNEARLLNATRKHDDLGRLLAAIATHAPDLAGDPEYHFWTGIVEYQKAVAQTDKQAQRAGLERASDSFRLALAAAPDSADWDAKYNYELTARLLAGMRKKNDDTPEKLNRGGMKILREDPDHPKEQQQKLAPDKQS